jgi:hypothetical protein
MTDQPTTFLQPSHEVRCPECGKLFAQWNARMKAALHYIEAHGQLLKSKSREAITREVLERAGKYELRLNQRNLLEYAATRTFFIIKVREDSLSAHSLEKLGMLAKCSTDDTPMRERFWVITTLGRLVIEAYRQRERAVSRRSREARKRLPKSHQR